MGSELEFKNQNIICFAGEDWWYHNPHSNLHIMQSFAQYNRILFVNSIGIRMPSFKKDKFAGKRIIRKLKSVLRYFKKVQENIYVLTPIALPIFKKYENIISRINKILLISQLILIIRLLNFRNPILWVSIPTMRDTVLYLRKKISRCLVYYCVDNIAFYFGANQEYISKLDTDIQKNSDLAFFVNHRLAEERKPYNKNTHFISHGVDYEFFARCQYGNLDIPADLKNIKSPIAGFIGDINGLDFQLVKFLAIKNKNISFVFIGRTYTELSEVSVLDNVYFLGKRPYNILPNYLQMFSCCCIYYEVGEIFNQYRNPKKLLEYLATGKPVVSVSILEIEYLKDYVYIAHNYDEFHLHLNKAIYDDSLSNKTNRISYVKEHTWDTVALEASKYIIDILLKYK